MPVIKGLASQFGGGPAWFRYTISNTSTSAGALDLTAAAATQTVPLFTMSAGSLILGVRIHHTTAFAGTAWTAATVSVGSTVVGNAGFASAFDIFQAVSSTAVQETSQFKSGTVVAQPVNAYFTITGGNVSVITAGSVDIDVLYLDCTNFKV
jgi:hypothetical protein